MSDTEKQEGIELAHFQEWIEASAWAEETLDIADAAIDAHDAQVRKLRIDTRKWLAARANPDNWGDRRDPLVNINVQDQHLVALRELLAPDDSVVSEQ